MTWPRTAPASQRTLMAADPSLMAWVRTALSMIGLGFAVYKVLQGFEDSGTRLGANALPPLVGLVLIGLGNLCLLIGPAEYGRRAKPLSAYGDSLVWRPSFAMGVAMALLSVSLIVGIVFEVLRS